MPGTLSSDRPFALHWNRMGLIAGVVAAAVGAADCNLGLPDTCSENETCFAETPASDATSAADSSSDEPDGPNSPTENIADGGLVEEDGGSPDSPTCDPTRAPKDDPCVLNEAYGVFVASAARWSAAADASLDAESDASTQGPAQPIGDGSRLHPYATLGQALFRLGNRSRIYVCNGTYPEALSLYGPVSIYGGLSCAPGPSGPVWSYVGGSVRLTSQPPNSALIVASVDAGVVAITDVSFQSGNALAPGDSSIAAMITSSTVNLLRVTLTAGAGADGAPGADGIASPNYAGLAPAGGTQTYTDTGTVAPVSAGQGAANACWVFGRSAGGDGGLGCSQGLGGPGAALPAAPAIPGRDGLSRGTPLADGGAAPTDDLGGDGLAGNGGAASPLAVYGTLSVAGWAPSPGGDGMPGSPGQGGAGATDPAWGACGLGPISLGGGGGGAGGCGGSGGKGGQGGGASIALVSVDATVTLQDCVLSSGAGGQGGSGGAGQDGQSGAAGGDVLLSSAAHAPGQAGGNGAGGSGGAGGTGGLSVGVLYQGGPVTFDTMMQGIFLGPPGLGGARGIAGKHGATGRLPTGADGNPGAPGNPGIAASFLQVR